MNSTKQNELKKTGTFRFAAIDQYTETYIISPKETFNVSKDLMEWGTGNYYPEYLLELYNTVPTLRSIINGNIDFITGDEISILPLTPNLVDGVMNLRGDTIREQVRNISKDYEIYGGFALQVIRNFMGEVSEVYYIDMRFLRTNKEGTVYYYCEDWNKKGRKDVVVYPAFIPNLDWNSLSDEEKNRNASSIVYVKNVTTQVYPSPLYSASVKACEIERLIDDFHISDINNHFVSSAIINFNNGDPGDEMKSQVEEEVNSKFCGAANGGRIMLSWNPNKEQATEILEFKVEDFGERYKALSEHSRQQIFTAFRANPNLFGIPTEGNGFANEQYEESYRLYSRTQIRPVQRLIGDTYDRIYGQHGVLTIKPFSLSDTTETNVN